MSENLEELPEGWVYSTLGDVCEPSQYGYTAKAGATGNYHFLRTTDITKPVLDWNNVPFCTLSDEEAEKYLLKDGDIVISRAGSIGYSSLINNPKKSVFASYLIRFRPLIYKKYLNYFLSTPAYWEAISEGSSGIAVQNVNATTLSAIELPIAPEKEQIRIVEKLEELLSDLDNGIAELKAAQIKLTQYRQSLLKSAVEGSLTQEWREVNTHKITETGEQLLARILKERRARWEQQKLEEFSSKNQTPPKDWQKKYSEPVKPDTSNLPELPEGWVWASLDMLGDIVSGVTKGTKRNVNIEIFETPYLRVANVQRGYLDLSEIKTIPATQSDIEKYTLKKGDILFNEGGDRDKLGRGWVWYGEVENCIHQNHVFRLRRYLPEIIPELISHYGNTFGKVWFQNAGKQTTNLASINKSILQSFPVPLSPYLEQVEIMGLLTSEVDKVDRQIIAVDISLKETDAQRKNILKDAFSGKLVPQNLSDEPASVLLEKINTERLVQVKNSKPKQTKKKITNKVSIMDTLFEVLKAKGDWMDAQEAFSACGVTDGGDFSDIVDKVESLYAELRKLEKEDNLIEIRRVGNYDQLKLRNGKVS